MNNDLLLGYQTPLPVPLDSRVQCVQLLILLEPRVLSFLFCELREEFCHYKSDIPVRIVSAIHFAPHAYLHVVQRNFVNWMWINRSPVPFVFGGSLYLQMKPCFIKVKSQIRPNFTDVNWQQKQVEKINPTAQVTLQSVNWSRLCGQNVSSFIALTVDDFEMPVSCERRLDYFCGACFNLVLISSGFPSVSTRRFLADFLSEVTP
jgi:hypothetical protein